MSELAVGELAEVEALRDQLDDLVGRGALGYDQPAVGFVQALLTRVEDVGEGARARLLRRADERIAALREAFQDAHARAATTQLELAVLGVGAGLQQAVREGCFEQVERRARRHRLARRQATTPARERSAERVKKALSERGMRADLEPRAAEQADLALAERLYRRAAARTSADFAIARSVDGLPDNPGRYNGFTVATDAIRAMGELGPEYLHAHLQRLADLAAVADFVAREQRPRQAPKGPRHRRALAL